MISNQVVSSQVVSSQVVSSQVVKENASDKSFLLTTYLLIYLLLIYLTTYYLITDHKSFRYNCIFVFYVFFLLFPLSFHYFYFTLWRKVLFIWIRIRH